MCAVLIQFLDWQSMCKENNFNEPMLWISKEREEVWRSWGIVADFYYFFVLGLDKRKWKLGDTKSYWLTIIYVEFDSLLFVLVASNHTCADMDMYELIFVKIWSSLGTLLWADDSHRSPLHNIYIYLYISWDNHCMQWAAPETDYLPLYWLHCEGIHSTHVCLISSLHSG